MPLKPRQRARGPPDRRPHVRYAWDGAGAGWERFRDRSDGVTFGRSGSGGGARRGREGGRGLSGTVPGRGGFLIWRWLRAIPRPEGPDSYEVGGSQLRLCCRGGGWRLDIEVESWGVLCSRARPGGVRSGAKGREHVSCAGGGARRGGCGGVAEELYEFLSCELRGVTDFKSMRKTNLRESSPQRDVLIPPASPLAPNPLQAAR